MLLGYGAKVCLRKMRVKAENRMVTSDGLFVDYVPYLLPTVGVNGYHRKC